MKKTILIIDDDDDSRFLLKYHLEENGFQIMEAKNGREGVNIAIKKIPDLILIDIMMPVMDGFSAIKLIKNNNKSASIPIIALTANTDEEEKQKCKDIGCNYYIEKPIDLKKLSDLVNHYTKN